MTMERVKRKNFISLDPDVILFEPDYRRNSIGRAVTPEGISFGGAISSPLSVPDTVPVSYGARGTAMEVLTDRFALSIHRIDDLLEERLEGVMGVLESGVEKRQSRKRVYRRLLRSRFYHLKAALRRHKKISLALAGCLVLAMFIAAHMFSGAVIYEYSYYGRTLGYAQTKAEVFTVVDLISEKINDEMSAEITFDKMNDLNFKRVFSSTIDTDSHDKILDNFTYLRSLKGSGVVIMADGERKVLVDSEDTANEVLEEYKAQYEITDNPSIDMTSVEFTQDIMLEPIETEVLKLKNKDDALEVINTIASDGTPSISVQTVELNSYTEDIPYDTEEYETEEYYEGDKVVTTQGQVGKKAIKAEVVRINRIEKSREILEESVAQEPVTERIAIGTKERPSYMATGSFMNPTSGTLTSRFGTRWGRQHAGLDIAAPYGTPIYAADSGTVSFSGSSSGYGLLIKIDHGNGVETRYGHCSSLLVSQGQQVLKGDLIAKVGSTGRSTGNHLHFEIRKNGTAINPLQYVSY